MDRELIQNLDAGTFQILAPTEGKRRRRFRMVAHTGKNAIQRMFGKAVFDLSGIQMGAKVPILMDHDASKRVGFADKAELTDEGLVLTGFLMSNEHGKQIALESDEGFPFASSVGLSEIAWEELAEGDTTEVNGLEFKGPMSVARKSRLLESSFLMAGADKDTHAVALAAQAKEADMKPEAFKAAHPEAVAAWEEAAAVAARTAQREELGAYLAAFPGRQEFAVAQFQTGATLLEAKAALSDVLTVELAAAKAAPPPVNPKATADAATLAKLAASAPGVGFDGQTQGQPPKPTVVTLWQDPKIQGEFNGNHAAYLQAVKRGLVTELAG